MRKIIVKSLSRIMKQHHILIMAGGTGGHIFPALAVADELRARGVQVSWLGTPKRMEAEIIPKMQIPLYFIDISGLRGRSKLSLLLAPWRLVRACWQAWRVLRNIKPDAVLGMGGFAAGPGALAAKLRGIPVYIHEQNSIAGLTNRLTSYWAKQVYCAFPNTFPAKTHAICLGNPVRQAFQQVLAPAERLSARKAPFRLLVLGGSLGAKALNELVPQAIAMLNTSVVVKHQCGRGHLATTMDHYQHLEHAAEVVEFIDDMLTAYQWADVIICRAGALTIAEISCVGVASILIPFPFAVDDHQTTNGQYLVNAGAALMLQQAQLTAEHLSKALQTLLQQPQRLLDMASAARGLAQAQAAKQLVDDMLRA